MTAYNATTLRKLQDIAEAALDQPAPTDELALALNRWLAYIESPLALKGRRV